MIPIDRDDLNVLAGEYVLGTLDPDAAREIETALASNAKLREAIAFWERSLQPLADLASPAAPRPPELWNRIEARLEEKPSAATAGPWRSLAFWRGATALSGAIAACLALYIALRPVPVLEAPSFVAVLHAPQQERAAWIATGSRGRLFVHTVAANTAPNDRAFELWAIPPGTTTPRSLGVIPPDGRMELAALPSGVREGGTLAISIEPKTGSPTGQPTGPVVFTGELVRAN
jgi:anti-sigma-K factor RskA